MKEATAASTDASTTSSTCTSAFSTPAAAARAAFRDSSAMLDDVHQQARDFLQRLPAPPPIPKLDLDQRTARIIWRDFAFLVGGLVAMTLIGFVETNASNPRARRLMAGADGTSEKSSSSMGIVDTGFIVTQPLYEWLCAHRGWNDVFAGINSIVLILPGIYVAYVTVLLGDYSLVFRVLAVQLLRAFCGWFTYLPPDATYLNSYFDFPDIVQCLHVDCRQAPPDSVPPFVSFFSGHVATILVAANHMWMAGKTNLALVHHFLNSLQIIRLLATRGHYSIDIIIGWYVAVYASVPAGKLGRLYSRGGLTTREGLAELLPQTPTEALESITGVRNLRMERRLSTLQRREFAARHRELLEGIDPATIEAAGSNDDVLETETIATLLHEQATVLYDQATVLRERLQEDVQAKMREAKESFDSYSNREVDKKDQ